MDNAIYTGLTRQSGLMREMQAVANNIANVSTTGFRREGVIFSEYVKRVGEAPSLSMARASARTIDLSQGELSRTGGAFDFAIQGDGFFLIETPQGERLSRAGHFTPNAEGDLVNPDGYRLLDAGGAPVFMPPDAGPVSLAPDGTLSAGGVPLARVGLWQPADPNSLRHEAGALFSADTPEPIDDGGTILQFHLEGANVNPITEIARMIEVQRAYEMGQSLMDREDERIRGVVQTLGR
ncbi:MAG: flagellar hook-basal body complex protein [Gemmobacter sp.]|nr:flagellar hook-basal body complex protein [Gemmobacter sp.]